MKTIKLLKKAWMLIVAVLSLSATATLTSCENSDELKLGEPYFYIEEDYANIIVGQAAYNKSAPYNFLTVRSNRSWQIVPMEEYTWCKPFPTEGQDDGAFRIIANTNDDIISRTAQFKIIVDGVEQPVLLNFTQSENAPYITVKTYDETTATKVEKDTISILGSAQEFYAYVKSNMIYTASTTDSWLNITQGADSTLVKVSSNDGENGRWGKISFIANDNPSVISVLTIYQEAGNYLRPDITTYTTGNEGETNLQIIVSSNLTDWTATTADSWITITGISGDTVKYTTDANTTGAQRDGTITLSSASEPTKTRTVTITQKTLGAMTGFEADSVAWYFSAADMPGYQSQYENDNALAANAAGTGYISYISNCDPTLDINKKIARIVGSTGHPYVTGAWPGDWWLFSIPVTNMKAGTKISLKYLTRVSGTGHKYWRLQCLDGFEWKDVIATSTTNETGETIEYNLILSASNITVDETYTYTHSIANGNIQFRMMCVANWQASGAGPLANPNGGTCRIAGAHDDTSPVFKVVP